jgi:hypothetical protein
MHCAFYDKHDEEELFPTCFVSGGLGRDPEAAQDWFSPARSSTLGADSAMPWYRSFPAQVYDRCEPVRLEPEGVELQSLGILRIAFRRNNSAPSRGVQMLSARIGEFETPLVTK